MSLQIKILMIIINILQLYVKVRKSRSHFKFLSGKYLTYKVKSDQSGGSPRCKLELTKLSDMGSQLARVWQLSGRKYWQIYQNSACSLKTI